MRALVTGGAGFIGSHVADALAAADARVLILDNLCVGRINNVQTALSVGAELVELDICHAESLERVFNSFKPEVVFHFAAHIDVCDSAAAPAFDATTNVIGSINLLALAAEHRVRRVVNASTGGAIYGAGTAIPTRETAAIQPICPYGLSKLAAETYARWFHQTHGLDVVTLRFGNVYGPRQDPAQGAVVARFCDQAVRGTEFEIFGTGDATRDYVYVADVVAASLEAGRREQLRHCVYNIGSGQEISVRELAHAVAIIAGHVSENPNIGMRPARSGEVLRSSLDISRARNEGILCIPTSLYCGIGATLAWSRTTQQAVS